MIIFLLFKECVFSAAGSEAGSYHDAPLLYHNNQPAWQEALRLAVPLDRFPTAHLRIDFRHCSSELLSFILAYTY